MTVSGLDNVLRLSGADDYRTVGKNIGTAVGLVGSSAYVLGDTFLKEVPQCITDIDYGENVLKNKVKKAIICSAVVYGVTQICGLIGELLGEMVSTDETA